MKEVWPNTLSTYTGTFKIGTAQLIIITTIIINNKSNNNKHGTEEKILVVS